MLPPSPRDFKDIYVVFELMETDLHQVGGVSGAGCAQGSGSSGWRVRACVCVCLCVCVCACERARACARAS